MEDVQDRRLFLTSLLLSAGLHLALAGAGVMTGWGRTLATPVVLEVKLLAPAPAPGEGLGSPPEPGGLPQRATAPARPPVVKKKPMARPRPVAPPPEPVKAAAPATHPASPTSPSLALAVPPRPVTAGPAAISGGPGVGNGHLAPGPGFGGGPGGGGRGLGGGKARGDYLGLIRARILAHRQYPARAREKQQEGVVRVRFRLSASGALAQGVEVVRPSGFSLLDDQARQCVQAAAPFPPLPRELQQDHLTIEVPIVYRLMEGE